MKRLIVESDIREALSMYEFEMFNVKNNHMGEITTLDTKDIDDILYDMRNGITVEVDEEGKVFVTYPHNICRLESRGKIIAD